MTTEAAHFEAPRGMRDFYPAEMAVRNAIFDACVRSARAFGFATANAARHWAGKAIASVPTAAPRTSWWLDATPANFTARAEQGRVREA